MSRSADVPVAVTRTSKPRVVHEVGRFRSDHAAAMNKDELDFVLAIDRYKREHRQPFPSWSAVLAVALSLGYRRVAEPVEA